MTAIPITAQTVLFAIFAALTVGAAICVVTSRNLFHTALWLVLALFGLAALYMLLEAPFIAGLQLFIYIGGIAVLIVMVIMVSRQVMHPAEKSVNEPLTALLTALLVLAGVVWMIVQIPWPKEPLHPAQDNLLALGQALVDPGKFVAPFEITSLLLLVVLLGAIYIAKER